MKLNLSREVVGKSPRPLNFAPDDDLDDLADLDEIPDVMSPCNDWVMAELEDEDD